MSQPMKPVTAESIFYKSFESYPAIAEDLIPGGLTVLAGSPKVGKSWLALDLALSVAQGVPFLGKSVYKTGVLYCCLEDTYLRIRNRMHKLVDEPPDDLYLTITSERLSSGFKKEITDFLSEHRDIGLIIVDTLQKIRGSDDDSGSGSYSKDYDEISRIKEIADLNNKSIVVIHHLRQKPDRDDPFNEISGTNGIIGVSDTNIVLKRREGSTTAEMFVRGRDIEERKLILEFADLRWNVLEDKSASELEKEKIPDVLFKIAGLVRERRSWLGSATDLLDAVDDHSVPPNQLAKQITRHYYTVFYPECILFDRPGRTNKLRGISLRVDPEMLEEKKARLAAEREADAQESDGCDACDGSPPPGW